MLFSNYRFILQILKNKIHAYKVDVKGLKIVETLEQEYANWEELPAKLAEIEKVFQPEEFFLLINETETKLYLFKLPLETQNTVSAVEEQLGLQSEDPLSSLTYDLKKMGEDEEEGVSYVQAIVARKEYLDQLESVLGEAGTQAATIENPSFALSRLTKKVKVPHLIYYKDFEQRILCACFEGEVFSATTLDVRKKLENAVIEMAAEVKGRYGFDVKSILTLSAFTDEFEEVKGFRIKKEPLLNPVLGLALKKDIKGADLDVLSLKFPEVEIEERNWFGRLSKKKLLAACLALLIVVAGFFGIKNLHNLKGNFMGAISNPSSTQSVDLNLKPTATLAPSSTPSPTPSPTPLPKSELKIKILNGSGATGAAGHIKQYLEEDGWVVDSVGNAARYDYLKTQIKIKKSKEPYLEMLKRRLAAKYEVSGNVSDLSESEAVDVIVIVGAK